MWLEYREQSREDRRRESAVRNVYPFKQESNMVSSAFQQDLLATVCRLGRIKSGDQAASLGGRLDERRWRLAPGCDGRGRRDQSGYIWWADVSALTDEGAVGTEESFEEFCCEGEQRNRVWLEGNTESVQGWSVWKDRFERL